MGLHGQELLAGDVLDERYRLLRVLGEGAAGTVWLARDSRLDIHVAVKILRMGLVANPDMLQRFVREADLVERMLSPSIVKVLARGLKDGASPYIVYERLEGETVSERLNRSGTLSVADTKTIIVHTCRALARAHAVGVLHRDIKPDNIFLTTDEGARTLAKVLDFGVAEIVASAPVGDRPLVGTLEYIAPEVLFVERPPEARSDLYAVGVVAYECLVGQVPIQASSVAELVTAMAAWKMPKASTSRPDLTPELDQWHLRALDRDPDKRFASAKEMAEALHVAGKGPEIRPSSAQLQAVGPMRPRASSFVFEEERRSSTYSIIPSEGTASERVSIPPSRKPPQR